MRILLKLFWCIWKKCNLFKRIEPGSETFDVVTFARIVWCSCGMFRVQIYCTIHAKWYLKDRLSWNQQYLSHCLSLGYLNRWDMNRIYWPHLSNKTYHIDYCMYSFSISGKIKFISAKDSAISKEVHAFWENHCGPVSRLPPY